MGTNKTSWKERRKAERDRQLIMLAIPIVLILLTIIIVAVNRQDKGETEPVTTETTTIADSSETPNTESESEEESQDTMTDNSEESPSETEETTAEELQPEEPSPGLLQIDAVPEINELMKAYYNARVNCDAETLGELYGKPEADVARLEAVKKQLLLYARYISSVDNLVCYTAQLENQDVWFVIMTADVHFRSTNTKVPTGQQFFVRKDAEGSFLLVHPEEITQEQQLFAEKISKHDEVRLLSLDINTRMKDAIDSDEELTKLYGTLNSGSPLWGEGEEETDANVEILTE